MTKIKLPTLLLLLVVNTTAFAQISDLFRVDYTFFPEGDSIVQYNRVRALVNVPIKLKKNAYLLLGADYSTIGLRFGNNIPEIDKSEIEAFRLFDFNISYTFKMSQDWIFGARFTPGFSSNLTEGSLFTDDIVFSGLAVFIKDKKASDRQKKPYRLVLGVSYTGNGGFPYPLPFISYYKRFHPKWSYNLGIPRSNLQYHYSERSKFKFFAELDGFNSNIQDGLIVNQMAEAERINMSLIVSGLRYEFKMGKHWELFANPGYILSNRVRLQDDSQNTVLLLSNQSTFYLRTGIRFRI